MKLLIPENIQDLQRDDTGWRTVKSSLSPQWTDDSTRERLDKPISLDELTKALESLEKNKTPRSDTLPVGLYSALWDLICQDLLEVYNNMLLAGIMCETMRKGIITLIDNRKVETDEIRNWRPVSLHNANYKVLAKVIASQVGSALGFVNRPDQTCAVQYRTITETLALLADTITNTQDSRVDTGFISLDQGKVFDRILHTCRKDVNLRGVTIPGSGGPQVKASLCMDEVTTFCSDLLSVCRLMSICNQFELASGAKVNHGKSEVMFFGNRTDQSFVPFIARTDYLKMLGIWFGGAGARAQTWKEHIAKVKQKLGFWEHCSFSIVGKNLVIGCETLTLLLYMVRVWPIHQNGAIADTRAIFHFIWKSNMDRVHKDTMHKTLDKGEKNVPNATLILMAIFVCGCIKLYVDPQYTNIKCHDILRFYFSSVTQDSVLYSLYPRDAHQDKHRVHLEDHQLNERYSLVCPNLVGLPEQG
eukprot:g39302.t1